MRAPGRGKSAGEADLIQDHPAIQRILNTQRAWVDGTRVLAYQTGLELDLAKHHPDAARRARAQRWCALITPVLKASCTRQAFDGASDCLQVFGGHGYVREWGIEQVVRDSRVSMIYEGTNEIQAIDLLVRKVLADQGQALNALWADLSDTLPDAPGVLARFDRLRALTQALVAAHQTDPSLAYWVADDYLRAVTLALLDWAWARIEAAPASATPERWTTPAQALRHWVLPEFEMRLSIIEQRLQTA